MKRRTLIGGLAGAVAALALGMAMPALAEDEVIYGRELMTEQELAEHRAKMRSLRTEQEREAFRMEHHKLMQERAKERGVTLPDEPGPRGKGMGMRDGRGMGQGPQDGRGMGQGPRDGRGAGQQ
ncbi:MAG: hypothetical protein ACOY5W_10220 [Pseudomonadota bacterium]